jgi:hypothetical protein
MSSAPQPKGRADQRASGPDEPKADRRWVAGLALLGLVSVALFLVLRGPTDPLPGAAEGGAPAGVAQAGGNGGAGGGAPTPFCRAATNRRAIGVRAQGTAPARPASPDADAGPDDEALLAPSGVSVGKAVVGPSGFALGVRRDSPTGSVADVARIDSQGVAAPLLSLGAVRGDLDAPALFTDGQRLVVGLLEPDAAGYSLRIGAIEADAVRWVEDLAQRRDESLAFDLAFGASAVAVGWDETDTTGDRTEITVAVLDRATLRSVRTGSRVSAAAVDGELPRIVARPGGFWVAYVARRPAKLPARPTNADLQVDPEENRHPAELIEPSWVEIIPLDDGGVPVGPPRPATARSGHAQEFDLGAGEEGAAWIVWRDDDTPTGAQGGTLHAVSVTMAGVGEAHLVADESRMLGGPQLFGSWLVASDGQGSLELGRLGSSARLTAPLRREPSLGRGLPLAASSEELLVASPVAEGVDLELFRCAVPPSSAAAVPPVGSAGPPATAYPTSSM